MNSRKILITGITSIHGWPIFRILREKMGISRVFGIRSPKMKIPDGENIIASCITDRQSLEKVKQAFTPTDIVHCAGVCDLDVCEERPHWARELNTVGTKTVADVFGDCHITYLSSDLVFSGNNPPRGGYDENAVLDPVSIAGKTIADAEKIVSSCKSNCIVRLGLPIGPSITGDKGAIDFIENRFKKSLPVTLFTDEFRSCITCEEIGEAVYELISIKSQGIYNLGGPAAASLHNIGEWILEKGGYDSSLLKGILRCEEVDGPPRIGNVSLNSSKITDLLGVSLSAPIVL
jgi:dTDP-4-dehydrorhamnose reductase